jgi:hypothetical protein
MKRRGYPWATAVLAVLVGGMAGATWVAWSLRQAPAIRSVMPGPEEAASAGRKLGQLLLAPRGGGPAGPVEFSEGELNAVLSSHLREIMGFYDIRARLAQDGTADLSGHAAAASLLPVALPGRLAQERIWMTVRVRPRVEGGGTAGGRRYLRLDVERLHVGRQRLPAFLLRHLANPGDPRALRWRLPATIEGVGVDGGRLVIRISSRPGRT